MLHNISIFGTSSGAGKSTLTFVIGKIIQELGYSVAPFKAQNVSNNAMACEDGSEIAVAQYFQAEVLNVPPNHLLNPVLLKSGSGNNASLILNGKAIKEQDIHSYFRDIAQLKPAVKASFEKLDKRYDCVVAEGAGSPVELNLMDKDLSNIYIAQTFQTKIILVADIENGGVFASIWGVYNLLPKALQKNVIGVIVNKFRGDMSLFDEGVTIIEKHFGIPVLGVLPYVPFNLGFEDSQSLMNYQQKLMPNAKRVGVIAYPTMSNYNDFEPLIADKEIALEFIQSNQVLENYDLIILPGSKQVMRDLAWLKTTGLFEQLQKRQKEILGICGGFEMMFSKLIDTQDVESCEHKSIDGLGLIDDVIYFKIEKVVRRGSYELFGQTVKGFEIHHGVSQKYPLYYEQGNIKGTFVHGLFNDEKFENYKTKRIKEFVDTMREKLNVGLLLKSIQV